MIPDAILTCSQKRSSLKHAETADAWTPVIDAPVIDAGTVTFNNKLLFVISSAALTSRTLASVAWRVDDALSEANSNNK